VELNVNQKNQHIVEQNVNLNIKIQVSLSMWKDAGIYPGKILIKRYLSEQKSGCWNCGITDWMNKSNSFRIRTY
jgi:hypothetical protein